MAIRTFAAIDVGSFELEMGIYEMSYKTGIRRVDHIRHVIALGKDTYSGGKISYGLVEEMCQVLGEFAQIMKAYRVKDYRAYATSAMREARNNQIILDQIRVRTGLTVRIISNSEQRFISYKAIAAKAGEFNKIIQKGTAIVDVGFGSAQLSLFDKDSLVTTQNLPLGTLRVRGLLANIPATVAEHREHIEEIVDNELFTFRKMYLKDREINNISLVDILTERTGLRVFMERDVNTALLYEIWKGHIDKRGIIIGIFIGTGLGNAMCIDGKVYIGNTGSACELGHIPVLGFADSCGCGKKGCIELKASGRTLYLLAEEKYHCPVSEIFERHGGEKDVKDVVHACAMAAATEITILDPNYVVLGGGVVDMKGFPMEYFEQTVKENLRIPYPRDSVRFIRALGDPEAGIVGAAINAAARMEQRV